MGAAQQWVQEIVVEVKIPPTRGKTERPRAPLLQLDTAIGIDMCRIGGRLRSFDASRSGANLEIPPLSILVLTCEVSTREDNAGGS